jgi:hypothetical protein
MNEIADGLYSYRFKGFAQDHNEIENFVVGIGTFRFTNGFIKGEHRATYLRLTGGAKPPFDGRFTVEGNIKSWDSTTLSGSAELVFAEQSMDPDSQVLTGQFAVVQAGRPGEYWLTSYGGADVQYGNRPSIKGTELVEGELRWISG